MTKPNIDEMATFCKKKGFVYPNSEIYGGIAGFWDYGHLGVELKNNIKKEWWSFHVQNRDDVVGIDGSIITSPRVWEASGHVENFVDIVAKCMKCEFEVRASHLIEDKLNIPTDDLRKQDMEKIIKEKKLVCPKCKSQFGPLKTFNLMFKTFVGPKEDKSSTAYLRPETAQLMFTNFRLVQEHARLKLPFGIAQIGRCFRNEISPRNFLFRCREFEIMEIEYFIHPKDVNNCPFINDVLDHEIIVYSEEMQRKKQKPKKMKIKQALDGNIIKTQWHAYWLATEHQWFISLGANPDNFRIRQHTKQEISHYALDTWDLEYNFPFGWKELQGVANRTDFDLKQHIKQSGKDLHYFDESTGKIIPYVVAEPSQGVERAFLVFMFDAYTYDKERGNVVLKLHPKLTPYKAAVFPLLSNKKELIEKAKEVYNMLKQDFNVFYDDKGSIGRRYSRQDEQGTPFTITLDFESLKNDDCTIRNRNDTKQVRMKIKDLKGILRKLISGEINFKKL